MSEAAGPGPGGGLGEQPATVATALVRQRYVQFVDVQALTLDSRGEVPHGRPVDLSNPQGPGVKMGSPSVGRGGVGQQKRRRLGADERLGGRQFDLSEVGEVGLLGGANPDGSGSSDDGNVRARTPFAPGPVIDGHVKPTEAREAQGEDRGRHPGSAGGDDRSIQRDLRERDSKVAS